VTLKELSGVGQATISRAERGKKISLQNAKAIADALGQRLEDLFVCDATVTGVPGAVAGQSPALASHHLIPERVEQGSLGRDVGTSIPPFSFIKDGPIRNLLQAARRSLY